MMWWSDSTGRRGRKKGNNRNDIMMGPFYDYVNNCWPIHTLASPTFTSTACMFLLMYVGLWDLRLTSDVRDSQIKHVSGSE